MTGEGGGPLGSSERRYRALVEHFPNGGVFLYDDELKFVLAGGTELDRVGVSPDEFVGNTLGEVFGDEIRERQAPHYRAVFDGETRVFEEAYDGEHYRIRTVPVRDESGAVVCGMAMSQNVTAQREYEAALEQQNARLAEFASIVSHDLRNPLSVATAGLELARETGADEDFDRVERAHDRMGAIIDDLLTLARQGNAVGETEPVELADAARAAWDSVSTQTATLDVIVDATIAADPGSIRSLFENLFRNCVEHGSTSSRLEAGDSVEHGDRGDHDDHDDRDDRGGEPTDSVTVKVGGIAESGDEVDGELSGFYVEDDGPGVPAAARDRVFESGYSTTSGGTGFGLNIVRAIAEAHGWSVAVADDADGARFEITGVRTT